VDMSSKYPAAAFIAFFVLILLICIPIVLLVTLKKV
jgi:hypothetical protein